MRETVDRVASSDIKEHIKALSNWVEEKGEEGWAVYGVTFMFRLTTGFQPDLRRQIERSIERLYAIFLTRCMRYPKSKENMPYLPMLIAAPDFPVYKKDKQVNWRFLPKGGLHYGAVLIVRKADRLKTGVVEHFRQNKTRYAPAEGILARIHIQRIDDNQGYFADYTFKAVKSRRTCLDDIIVLPKSSEDP